VGSDIVFIAAYFVARFLWVPLLACWSAAKGSPGRGAMWLPIAVGIAATVWEAMISVQTNIRIDLFLVAPLLIFAEGAAGLFLAASSRRAREERRPAAALGVAAALCLGGCAFFIGAWVQSDVQSDRQWQEYEEGSRNYFEAALRDDETQRASFGDLQGTRWAGYYVGEPAHPNYGHLIVNSAGDYFEYTTRFGESRGHLEPDAGDPALLRGKKIYVGVPVADVEIRDLGEGRLRFQEIRGILGEWTFVKRPPPRFPRMASPNDKVHFRGTFSGAYDESSAGYLGLAQIWLWESDGEWWAAWLRGSLDRTRATPVSANARADVACKDKACEAFEVRTEGGGRELLRWQSPDALSWNVSSSQVVTLKRGEIVTGLPYAWAPLASMEENRKWLRSLHPEVTWKAPARK
jgi:hypothetical protein